MRTRGRGGGSGTRWSCEGGDSGGEEWGVGDRRQEEQGGSGIGGKKSRGGG